ncbi:MAG TPA: lipase secretion chaperone [Spirochaetota bacterium]|nr:lipase secretion chaperone [Spirochaetota bacterium]HPC41311.1 lipase secretion chaperone [Spirochaetota bacterium]HPL17253.1 lipase secretion chaperone [Spirochaetota bacterium]HQF09758.1 lipase secretion chaperone [Spirochaetota bacterium]HQH98907.1 lipase secretion chaperone [Spirochaetota bacterium]
MNKRSKTVFIAASFTAAMVLMIFLLRSDRTDEPAGIIDKKYRITRQDYLNSLHAGKKFDSSAAGDYFRQGAANKHTLDFFSFLQDSFKDMEYADHMKAVRDYLLETIKPRERADEMYELYARYTEYQKELYMDRDRWAPGGTPEEMLENLRKIQDFRRRRFGEDAADSIFGVEVKSNEYALRKQIVIGNAAMSGKEKEERLAALRREMWGDQADTIDGADSPRDRYDEKLKIYQADLAAMGEEERERKLREFRREIFTPEEAARMDSAGSQLKFLRDRDREYSRLSREILDDSSLSEQEKRRRIRELHDRLYGGSGKPAAGTE